MAMKPKSRIWVDDKDKLFHTEITVTMADGISHSFEGKGESLRASRRDAQLIYDAFLEDVTAEQADSTRAASTKSGARNDSPDSITQQARDITIGSANSDVNIKSQSLQPPPLRSKPIEVLLRSQPVQPSPRSEPPRHLPRYPSEDMYNCLPGPARPQYNNHAHRQDMLSDYRAGPQTHRSARGIENNRRRRQRPPSYPPSQGESNSWAGNTTASASTGSNGNRSKKLKTNKAPGAKMMTEQSPECAEDEELVVELDDTGECYMSKLNLLKPKIQHLFDKHEYKCIQASNNASHWVCTMSVRDLKASEGKGGEEVLIVIKKMSKSKKEAKQVAAKCLIEKINGILDEARAKGEDVNPTKKTKTVGPVQEENDVSILHQWWQKKLIKCKPDIPAKQMDGKPEGDGAGNNPLKQLLWKATYVGKLEGVDGELVFHGIDSVKQNARKKAAHAAVKAIRAMKMPGFEEALVPKKDASKLAARRDEACPENTREMVQLSDDEDCFVADTPIDSMFSLPSGYAVVMAKTVKDCDEWAARLLENPMDIGVYVDSVFMRKEMLELAGKIRGYDAERHDKDTVDCRVICMGTEASALLMCMDSFPEIPESVCDVLGNDNIRKLGMWPDASKAALMVNYTVNTSSICNLSMDSFALSGTRQYGIWHSLESIVKLWMKQSFQPFATASIGSIPGMQELIDSTDALVAPAVLAAAVGPRVDKYFKQMAASKEQQFNGMMVGFQDIADRLTAPSIHSRKRTFEEAYGN